MTAPRRIQRRRVAGWRMPPNTVYVGRPTQWGNPFTVGATVSSADPLFPYLHQTLPAGPDLGEWVSLTTHTPEVVVAAYRYWLLDSPFHLARIRTVLAGRNLACWCPLDMPCHADVLLAVANEGAEVSG